MNYTLLIVGSIAIITIVAVIYGVTTYKEPVFLTKCTKSHTTLMPIFTGKYVSMIPITHCDESIKIPNPRYKEVPNDTKR